MANKIISMAKIRHILRLYSQGRGKLQIAEQTGVARNTIKKYIKEFEQSALSFEQINELSDKDLEDLFVSREEKPLNEKLQALFSLFPVVDKELKKKGVTRQMLWEDYRQQYPQGVGRSQFNHYYGQWRNQVNPTMRMEHKAGDKMYVDFAGDRLSIIDKQSGEIQYEEVERTALKPLPPLRYELKKQLFATVMKNRHVSLGPDKHYYSVPYRF